MKIYFVAGASGSGKTAILPELKKILGEPISVYDFDDIGVPNGADKKWRQEATEQWLKKLLSQNKDVCLLGQMVLGEILSCPTAKKLDLIHFCLLDVSDIERVRRLKTRNTYGMDQNMLNWASWLRMHHQDPQWMPNVFKENCWEGMDFSCLDNLSDWALKSEVKLLDTTYLTINDVASAIKGWIYSIDVISKLKAKEIADNKIVPSTELEYDFIDNKIIEFNKSKAPFSQESDFLKLNFNIKSEDKIIAGINATLYCWKILYVDVIYVDPEYRSQDLGHKLLSKVETEAKNIGAELVHLDTFDFQAKGFYLRNGYELFGVLKDCPKGHFRYYLKKTL